MTNNLSVSVNSSNEGRFDVPASERGEELVPPDVLLVICHLGHGGAQRVVCNLANALCRQGYRVTILLTARRDNNALNLDPSVRLEFLVYDPPRWSFAHLAGLYHMGRWLPKLRARIKRINALCVVSFIRPTNVQVLIAFLGLRDRRIIVCERNDPQRQVFGRHWALLSRLLYRTADLVTFNSEGVRSSLAAYVPEGKLHYLPNILTIPASQCVEQFPGPVVLAVGRLVPQKGYDVLIKAFAQVRERMADWRLVFLGEGPQEAELQKLAENLGVATRIEWRGHVADPFAFYRGASIFVLPSRYEGMPNALLEAMSFGLPAIVSDASPGPLEVIDQGENGLIVPTDDVAELAAALTHLAGDEAARKRLGAAARQRVQAFLPDRAINDWAIAIGLSEDRQQEDLAKPQGKVERQQTQVH